MSAPSSAMLLAAGLGTRMRPLTLTRPKPLVEVAGRPLIDHAVERLREAGVQRVVVNVHWLVDRMREWVARQVPPPEFLVSDETAQLLETGGGLNKALPLLGPDAFYAINTDSIWLDEGAPALRRLAEAWDDARMDCLVLTVPPARAVGHSGGGDFAMSEDGRVRRAPGEPGAEVFTGVQIVHPRLFREAPEGPFSMNLLFDVAMKAGRMYALSHDGLWLHVGTPEAVAQAEEAMAARKTDGSA